METTQQAPIQTDKLSIYYGAKQAVKDIDLNIEDKKVTAIIGPSGCGKSTFLRALNRMHDFNTIVRIEGKAYFNGQNIYSKKIDSTAIRRKIGMVFQKPNPFPKSIYKNIAWGPKINGISKDVDIDELVQTSLEKAALWNEVKDRLNDSALELSGGQQQRLCIARTIAMNPDVILMDEPCSALDPKATAHIEKLILDLKEKYTIIIVTHNMQQAARISENTAFFYEGELIEYGVTKNLFTKPKLKQTEDYITGRFG